ncbi:toxin-antitoxin system, antitoxin component, PHD family [Parvimonas sp. KA00067]|uniref:type II toxin-antitoxin system Phd/YefM family antitoxin n=1 Tax=Parvimonas sp. KA00067 TaxID=1588755 RepID=UPI0007933A55|nr:type II toxin-antitoxin system Phd/YefM family antitoxin [Parvimonas sp. KA00067]KXB66360.1 toxin-antitoxin system, antitoxin component, PHD family [Parvimonas sp. KA00067]
MINTTITNFRKNLFSYVESAVEYNDILNISTKNGNAILINEEEYIGLIETLYLISNPESKEKLDYAIDLKVEDCEEFSWE